jgi:hypothetical protein
MNNSICNEKVTNILSVIDTLTISVYYTHIDVVKKTQSLLNNPSF